jgi:hypothetical protein
MTMASGRTKERVPTVPGPGAYNTNKSLEIKRREPTVVFGNGPKAAADLSTRRIVPGPGMYKLPR